MLLAFIITTNDETTTLRLIYKNRHFAVCFLCKIRQLKNYDYLCTIIHKGMETVNRILQEKITARIAPNKAVLIFGARRVGKTVMMRKIVDNYSGRTMMLNGEDYDT